MATITNSGRIPLLGPLQVILGGVVSMILYGLVLIAVFKLFQIHSTVNEVKELVKGIKNDTHTAAVLSAAQSPENLARALQTDSDPSDRGAYRT
jgi:hypothetical protein